MDLDKLPSNTEYSFAHLFYPVGNLGMRGGYSWAPIRPQTQTNHILDLPQFNVLRSESIFQRAPYQMNAGGMTIGNAGMSGTRRRSRRN